MFYFYGYFYFYGNFFFEKQKQDCEIQPRNKKGQITNNLSIYECDIGLLLVVTLKI